MLAPLYVVEIDVINAGGFVSADVTKEGWVATKYQYHYDELVGETWGPVHSQIFAAPSGYFWRVLGIAWRPKPLEPKGLSRRDEAYCPLKPVSLDPKIRTMGSIRLAAAPTADWERCRHDLDWSQANEKKKHRDALEKQRKGEEASGFDQLMDIQDHNPPVKRNYDLCHAADQAKFWEIAWDVYHP